MATRGDRRTGRPPGAQAVQAFPPRCGAGRSSRARAVSPSVAPQGRTSLLTLQVSSRRRATAPDEAPPWRLQRASERAPWTSRQAAALLRDGLAGGRPCGPDNESPMPRLLASNAPSRRRQVLQRRSGAPAAIATRPIARKARLVARATTRPALVMTTRRTLGRQGSRPSKRRRRAQRRMSRHPRGAHRCCRERECAASGGRPSRDDERAFVARCDAVA